MKKKHFWMQVWQYTKEFKKNIVVTIIGSLFAGVCVALQPLIIKYIVDEGITKSEIGPARQMMTVCIFCGVYLLCSLGRVSFWALGYKNILVAVQGFLYNLRTAFYRHIQWLPEEFYNTHSSGELFNYIVGSPISNISNYLQSFTLSVPYQFVSLIISLSALIYYDWLLTIILLALCVICVTFNQMSRKKIRKLSSDFMKTEAESSKYIMDMLHGNRAVRMYSIENKVYENFTQQVDTLREKGITLSFRMYLENIKPELAQYGGTILVYLVGAFSCIYRGLSTGTLFAFIGSMSSIMGVFNTWFGINLQKGHAEAGLNRIQEILSHESPIQNPSPEERKDICDEKRKTYEKNSPCIEFRNVTFQYDHVPLYQNFNCKIYPNESIALVGSSGSGKSTFVKLLMRLFDIDSGELFVYGNNIKSYPLHELRSHFGIVPQEPFMFQDSIRENIRIARPEATDEEIDQAMEIAHVTEFVSRLENGADTVIGEGGHSISGGQRQRVAIARAVLCNPDILIFDEATSALDNISERLIQESLHSLMKDHTIILIAHRLSTVRHADRILVFEEGEIVEQGTFEDLDRRGGKFHEMLHSSEKDKSAG